MLRKVRIVLAVISILLITWLFVDFTGTAPRIAGWLANIQFLPAVLALNVGVIIALIVLTFVFGRIYCSVICPLGILQDVLARLRPRKNKKVGRYSFSPEMKWLRYPVLVVFIIALIAGVGSFVALLAPYSSFGRIASNLFAPVYEWINNGLASIAAKHDSYAFYNVDVWMRSLPTFIIAAVTLVVLAVLAWIGGRTYCNTICPVGTFLSFISRFSLLKIRFDEEKCRNCSACSKSCKASCIDFKSRKVDYSRCVVCGDCLEACKFDALKWGLSSLPLKCEEDKVAAANNESPLPNRGRAGEGADEEGASRRSFLIGAGLATATAALAQEAKLKVDGGLADIEDKVAPKRTTPIIPPGALSARHFAQHCTGCQLCVAQCPNHVLRPSTGLMTLMQPMMSFERGYCRPECNRCAEVCPTDAIRPITVEEKTSTQVGHAVWIKKNCVAVNDHVDCDNCSRHCPTGAIEMVPLDPDDELGAYVPAINEAKCIGCGACENLCPARPFSAIYVEGHEVHKEV
jgi:ferredoxin